MNDRSMIELRRRNLLRIERCIAAFKSQYDGGSRACHRCLKELGFLDAQSGERPAFTLKNRQN